MIQERQSNPQLAWDKDESLDIAGCPHSPGTNGQRGSVAGAAQIAYPEE